MHLPNGENIHGKGDADVNEESTPDGTGPHGQGSQDNTRDDGSETLHHRFADVDHDIRDHHGENGRRSHDTPQRLEHESPEEKLQREELGNIERFPDRKVEK